MKKQLIVTGWQSRILTALYENDSLCELWLEDDSRSVRVGDIYIGKVKHIVPNIQAAFVEITAGVMGYYSLRDNTQHFFANPKKQAQLVAGDEILVQVEKENLKTKAWTLTGHLSLPGRYVVLNAGQPDTRISSKIHSAAERERLKTLAEENLKPAAGIGWLFRTEAAGQDGDSIRCEMAALEVDYNNLMSTYRSRTCFSRLRMGDTLYLQLFKRLLAESDCTVTTDQSSIYEALDHRRIEAGSSITLKYYADASYPLVKLKGIEAQIEKATQKRVWMKSGAYLVIEPTEALTVIDVNTGKAIGKQNMEAHFLRINQEAALEVCRQLRLRNLSGIIIVDFINMKEPAHLQQLMTLLRSEAAKDPVQTTIVDRTALHLVEITRKKIHRPLREQLSGRSAPSDKKS